MSALMNPARVVDATSEVLTKPLRSDVAAKLEAMGKESPQTGVVAAAVGVRAILPETLTTLPTLVHLSHSQVPAGVLVISVAVGVYVPEAIYCWVVPVTVPVLWSLVPETLPSVSKRKTSTPPL